MQILPRAFYERDTAAVARELLGKWLVRVVDGKQIVTEICETEAYLGVVDKAAHSYGGRRTARTEVMFGEAGHAYVYFVYGVHNMLNVVTEKEGNPCAILIRGAFAVTELDAISRVRFGKEHRELRKTQARTLLDGPGKLCKGLQISREHNGADLCTEGALYICENAQQKGFSIQTTKRIGIDYAEEAVDWPLRFVMQRN